MKSLFHIFNMGLRLSVPDRDRLIAYDKYIQSLETRIKALEERKK